MTAAAWTAERVARLVELHDAGLSASLIAEALGGGLSRNAVIGKLHRIGAVGRQPLLQAARSDAPAWTPERVARLTELRRGGAGIRAIAVALGVSFTAARDKLRRLGVPAPACVRAAHPWRLNVRPPSSSPPIAPDMPEPDAACRVPLLAARAQHCRYPYGAPGADFRFCGSPVTEGCWCAHHRRLVYRPAPARALERLAEHP